MTDEGRGPRTTSSTCRCGRPAATSGLLEVFRRRYLLRLLVRREISARYSGSFLGLVLVLHQPDCRSSSSTTSSSAS